MQVTDKATQATHAQEVTLDRDEGPRPDTTLEKLAALKPVYPGGTTTAGNASQLSDGAAAVVMMEAGQAARRGLAILGLFRGMQLAAVAPEEMSIAIAPAIRKVMAHHGLAMADVDLWELHEAYAVTTLYNQAQLETPWESHERERRRGAAGPSVRDVGHPLPGLDAARARAARRPARGRRGVHGGRDVDGGLPRAGVITGGAGAPRQVARVVRTPVPVARLESPQGCDPPRSLRSHDDVRVARLPSPRSALGPETSRRRGRPRPTHSTARLGGRPAGRRYPKVSGCWWVARRREQAGGGGLQLSESRRDLRVEGRDGGTDVRRGRTSRAPADPRPARHPSSTRGGAHHDARRLAATCGSTPRTARAECVAPRRLRPRSGARSAPSARPTPSGPRLGGRSSRGPRRRSRSREGRQRRPR